MAILTGTYILKTVFTAEVALTFGTKQIIYVYLAACNFLPEYWLIVGSKYENIIKYNILYLSSFYLVV